MFTFTPLLGAQSPSPASQSLLELDGGVKILVDVGWDESFDSTKLQALEKHVSTLSIVLLTHATIEHIGAYAHCCKHVPGFSRIPCYATTPVMNMGRTLTLDLYGSSPNAASTIPRDSIYSSPVTAAADEAANLLLQAPTADEVATYFSLINPLKYSQPHQPIPSPFSPPLAGLTITAYSAGHTLGGTLWHIQHGLESIVYASDWNLGRENFLPGAAWLSSGDGGEVLEPLHRPTALVCSSRGVERTETLAKRDRDLRIVSLIRETVAQGGKVLIPTDSSSRVLELAFLLNTTWRENIDGPHSDTYRNARIYMASRGSKTSVRYLQSMLEWMDASVVQNAEAAITRGDAQGNSSGPLDWKFVHQVERRSQVEKALKKGKPCVLLASDASLEWGVSSQALQSLASNPKNLVILTEVAGQVEAKRRGVGRQLWEMYQSRQGLDLSQNGAKVVNGDGHAVELRLSKPEPLTSDENMVYQQYIARQRQMHSSLQGDTTLLGDTAADLADDQASESSESEDEDDDAEHQGRAFNVSAQLTSNKRKTTGLTDAELGVNILLRGKDVYDYDVRNKRGREKMFPFVAHRSRNDEFGDVIKPEDYLRAEERDDVDGVDLKNANVEGVDGNAAKGQKRKWDDSVKGRRDREQKGPNKKAKTEQKDGPDAIDAVIAKVTGESGSGGGGAVSNGTVEEESSDSEESEYEPEDDAEAKPQKIAFSTQSLELHLRIAYVDFSGLYRLNDLQGLIGRINPRKLIVTAGDMSETRLLADTCRAVENGTAVGEIFTPVDGEVVDASVDTNAWTVKLTRQLVRRLNWKDLGTDKPSIAAISGLLGSESAEESLKTEPEEEGAKKKLKLTKAGQQPTGHTDSAKAALPILDLLTAQSTTLHQRAAQPVHVGDLRLAEIRAAVQAQGHTAEFRGGGTLLVDGTVLVRKSPTTGSIEVEGANAALSTPGWRTMTNEATFYAVKRVIYERLAVVSGA
ncbi:uncharacterized protein LTR77_006235 [Saxophila tyrrhenica]|uniref:Cleavage and polyadenylation specificity factor subunit 2 n=1 Tax=Saxophila tyrrhenica TaxID=1690608 RepID=A0AAV9P7K6_9PEZI|nr:hypothetical protein LTR77_006235 [Saxophila tyrrhenica]